MHSKRNHKKRREGDQFSKHPTVFLHSNPPGLQIYLETRDHVSFGFRRYGCVKNESLRKHTGIELLEQILVINVLEQDNLSSPIRGDGQALWSGRRSVNNKAIEC